MNALSTPTCIFGGRQNIKNNFCFIVKVSPDTWLWYCVNFDTGAWRSTYSAIQRYGRSLPSSGYSEELQHYINNISNIYVYLIISVIITDKDSNNSIIGNCINRRLF